ncbi:hypothetical protein HW49_06880 [Porphyromonadaceae bacterium COT-184 OH4590]|nr:hypothetical protein HW49_06880 [Porphyromonadaceae bacterium COT-184 OH4590]
MCVKKIVLTILCVSFVNGLILGQNFDDIMSVKRQLTCSDIASSSGLYFVKYMQQNELDSARLLLEYWESKCGMREPIYRAKILLALKENSFKEWSVDEVMLSNIFNYKNRINVIKTSNYYQYEDNNSYYGFVPIGKGFDRYTQYLANSLINQYQPGQTEYLLAEFYSENNDSIFEKLQTKPYSNSSLAIQYKKVVNEYLNMVEGHMSWITGIWIPTGRLSLLGVHPELGFQLGLKHKKMNYDLTLTIRFLNSANYYYGRRSKLDDFVELTNHFFSGYIGLEVGRDIYAKNGHEIQLTGGVAFDGFDVLNEDKYRNLKSASTYTYNINFGLGYRYYIKNSFYLGLRAKYNIVDYSLNKVINFTGNPITVQFIVGGLENVLKYNALKVLRYKNRR